MIEARQRLHDALVLAVREVAGETGLPQGFEPVLERPRQASHGDVAITAAMTLAKPLKRNPRELGEALAQALRRQPAMQDIASIELAGPGFLNVTFRPQARQAVVSRVLADGARFGVKPSNGRRVMVEFVSANPTGPLHLGHARQGALGDSVCRLLETQGWQTHREFYYNDAGVQIGNLAESVRLRLAGVQPGDAGWPEDGYQGDYIAEVAEAFRRGETVRADDRSFTASGDPADLDGIRQFAVAYLRHEQDLDLKAFGIAFDHYFLESGLYTDGKVDAAVRKLVDAGKTYEADGALWLKSTEYGDDKDRVMRKSDGTYTYFVPDVAYHIDKWQRGFDKVVNIQGSDHHGTVARVRAGLQAAGVGIPQGWPDYLLHKMVTAMRGGQEVKISKRAGGYVTLRNLIEWTSRDAVRFFLASRKADTEFVFDIDLALKQSDENPVFYVQYAHARICSVLAQWRARGGAMPDADTDVSLLVAPTEQALLSKLSDWPDVLTRAADALAPHDVAFYLRDLAGALHAWYAAERFLVDDPALARARMALLAACAQVLRNGLAVLGVSAPEQMSREAPEAADAAASEPAPESSGV